MKGTLVSEQNLAPGDRVVIAVTRTAVEDRLVRAKVAELTKKFPVYGG